MTMKEQTEIFTKNLVRLLKERNLTQKEVADAIGVSQQTFNMWCVGKNLPRMDKVEKLSNFLGVRKSDLLDNPEKQLEETLEEAFDRRPDMRALFMLAKNCTPDEIEKFTRMLQAYKNTDREG